MAEAAQRGFHYGHPDWSNLGQGAPEVGPLPGAPDRIEQMALPTESYEYAPVGGLMELRAAVAQLYNDRYRRGMRSQYTAENVAISSGGRAGLTRVAASLGSVHLGHFLPDYTAYEELLETFRGFVPIPILLDPKQGFTIELSRLRDEIMGAGLAALLLSNPCNPTGHLVQGDELARWVDTCRELSCCLIVDEFYAHFLYGGESAPSSVSASAYVEDVDKDPVVLVDGLTKNWRYPGFRLSWTLGPRSIIERVTSAGSFLDGGPPHPLQKAVLPLIAGDVADREARAIQDHFGNKRKLVLDRVRSMGMKLAADPSGGFYAFAALDALPPALRDGMDFFRAALDRNVIVVPGEFFDVNPGQRRGHIPSRLKGYVRISYGPDMGSLVSGLDRL
ncbi:MAG TPA: pyridoxal phosphate-dependent aminotransferase, partial [Deltaproteobacteria bacterium]|nr:pyridoxal phosphate-dependent aminotransferase [Deltaproteobacteria bacterium]